jgi:undecaprenyl-diphosphatase
LSWDLALFHLINGYAGGWALDNLAFRLQSDSFVRGGIFMMLLWYFWFRPGSGQQDIRERVACILIGALLALAAARTMAAFVPFRTRPMYDVDSGYHPLTAVTTPFDMEAWNSFPSDHAAFCFALSAGLYVVSRPVGLAMMVYSVFVVGLPRIYLGAHYPSDLLVGALLGAGIGRLAVNRSLCRLTAPRLQACMNASAGLFYAAFFAVTFEMATMFDHVRAWMRAVHAVVSRNGLGISEEASLAILVAGFALGLALTLVLYRRHRHRSMATAGR